MANSITLQFARGGEAEARLIEWFGHGRWSHVDAVLPDGRLLGARLAGGVAIRPANYLPLGTETLRVQRPCSDAQEGHFYVAAEKQVGKPYDFSAIAGFAAGRDWRLPDHWICSELAAAMLEEARMLPKLCAPDNKLTPDDLALVLSAVYPRSFA
jgi:hypothetical protein